MANVFHALDVAAYIKWANLSIEAEYELLLKVWDLRKKLLVRSCTRSFSSFRGKVYKELHSLWRRNYVSEQSEFRNIPDLENYPPAFLTPAQAGLEAYLRIMALHLHLTPNVPYMPISLVRILPRCGKIKASKRLWTNLVKLSSFLAFKMLYKDYKNYTLENFMKLEELILVLEE